MTAFLYPAAVLAVCCLLLAAIVCGWGLAWW